MVVPSTIEERPQTSSRSSRPPLNAAAHVRTGIGGPCRRTVLGGRTREMIRETRRPSARRSAVSPASPACGHRALRGHCRADARGSGRIDEGQTEPSRARKRARRAAGSHLHHGPLPGRNERVTEGWAESPRSTPTNPRPSALTARADTPAPDRAGPHRQSLSPWPDGKLAGPPLVQQPPPKSSSSPGFQAPPPATSTTASPEPRPPAWGTSAI